MVQAHPLERPVAQYLAERWLHHAAAPALLGACASDQIGSHELRGDSLCLLSRVVELDLDAVRVVEEKLEQRLPIGAALAEVDVLPLEVLHHVPQPRRAKRDVIDRARALPRALRGPAEIFLLGIAGRPGARPD